MTPGLWLARTLSRQILSPRTETGSEAAEVLRINPVFTMEKWKCLDVYRHSMDSDWEWSLSNSCLRASFPALPAVVMVWK